MKIHYDWEKIWEMKSWYPFSHYTAQTFKKYQKPIENIEFCWKISQNWGKIWEISSLYPFSHYTVQNFKKCQRNQNSWNLLENPPNWEKIWEISSWYPLSHHKVQILIKYSKMSKPIENSWNLLTNLPKLRENLGNFILISI